MLYKIIPVLSPKNVFINPHFNEQSPTSLASQHFSYLKPLFNALCNSNILSNEELSIIKEILISNKLPKEALTNPKIQRAISTVYHILEFPIFMEKFSILPETFDSFSKDKQPSTIVFTAHPSKALPSHLLKHTGLIVQELNQHKTGLPLNLDKLVSSLEFLITNSHQANKPSLKEEADTFLQNYGNLIFKSLANHKEIIIRSWDRTEADGSPVQPITLVSAHDSKATHMIDSLIESMDHLKKSLERIEFPKKEYSLSFERLNIKWKRSKIQLEELEARAVDYSLINTLHYIESLLKISPESADSLVKSLPQSIRHQISMILEVLDPNEHQHLLRSIEKSASIKELHEHLFLTFSQTTSGRSLSKDGLNFEGVKNKLLRHYEGIESTYLNLNDSNQLVLNQLDQLLDKLDPAHESVKEQIRNIKAIIKKFSVYGFSSQSRLDARQIMKGLNGDGDTVKKLKRLIQEQEVAPPFDPISSYEDMQKAESVEDLNVIWERKNNFEYFLMIRLLNAGNNDSINTLVISNFESEKHYYAFHYLCLKAGLITHTEYGQVSKVSVNVMPLIENVDAFKRALSSFKAIFQDDMLFESIKTQGYFRVMEAFSDTPRDNGFPAALTYLMTTPMEIVALGKEHGIPIRFQYGRGSSFTRNLGVASMIWMQLMEPELRQNASTTIQAGAREMAFDSHKYSQRTLAFMESFGNPQDVKLTLAPHIDEFKEVMRPIVEAGMKTWDECKQVDSDFNQYLVSFPVVNRQLNDNATGSRVKPYRDLTGTSIIAGNRAISVTSVNRLLNFEFGTVLPFVSDMKAAIAEEKFELLKKLFLHNKAFQVYLLNIWEGFMRSSPESIDQWHETLSVENQEKFKAYKHYLIKTYEEGCQILTALLGLKKDQKLKEFNPDIQQLFGLTSKGASFNDMVIQEAHLRKVRSDLACQKMTAFLKENGQDFVFSCDERMRNPHYKGKELDVFFNAVVNG